MALECQWVLLCPMGSWGGCEAGMGEPCAWLPAASLEDLHISALWNSRTRVLGCAGMPSAAPTEQRVLLCLHSVCLAEGSSAAPAWGHQTRGRTFLRSHPCTLITWVVSFINSKSFVEVLEAEIAPEQRFAVVLLSQ